MFVLMSFVLRTDTSRCRCKKCCDCSLSLWPFYNIQTSLWGEVFLIITCPIFSLTWRSRVWCILLETAVRL